MTKLPSLDSMQGAADALSAVRESADNARRALVEFQHLLELRDEAIRAAFEADAGGSAIAQAAKVHRSLVYRIKDEEHD